MNRTEVYNKIRALNLQEEVKNTFGDIYTRISSDNLLSLISKKALKQMKKKSVPTSDNKFNKLLEVLSKKHILLSSEVNYINQ